MPEPLDPAAIGGWHLDKRIPLALIIAIVVQTGGALWWTATLSTRVGVLERQVQATSDLRDRFIVVEAILKRIEYKVDRTTEDR